MLQYCVPLQWCTVVRAVLTGQSTVSGFDLGLALSSKHLSIFGLHGVIYGIFNFCCIYFMF